MDNNEVEILLVEDNIHDAELTIRSLKKMDLANRLFHVNDGEKALDFVFGRRQFANKHVRNRPRLILLDIKMPKVDGIEVLRQIRSNEATKTIPVVIMSSSKEEQDITNSYNLGVNGYVVKPVNFEAYGKAVSELGSYWLIINQPPL